MIIVHETQQFNRTIDLLLMSVILDNEILQYFSRLFFSLLVVNVYV